MRFKLRMCVVVIAFDRCLLDRPVHALNLPVRPGMVHLGQALVDGVLPANTAEGVFEGEPVLLAVGELDAVIGQDRMDLVRHRCDQIAQELGGDHLARSLM